MAVRVLVIGGGIGGLCLAHGLRAAGVEVRVYERGHTRDDWLQGYRIHLNPAGSTALHACLPAAQWAAFEAGVAARGPRRRLRLPRRAAAHAGRRSRPSCWPATRPTRWPGTAR